MAGKAQSLQERLLTPIFEFSLAAPFVFAPDEWLKGSAPREPADLAWACNGCVILIHMTERQSPYDKSKLIRIREDAIDHNLRQLKGWMNAWKRGQPLLGRNRFQEFSISYGDDLHVVALSVIKCEQAEARFHPEVACDLGVALCATVPQSFVEGLAGIGGTTLDLIEWLNAFRVYSPMPETQVLAELGVYLKTSCKRAGTDVHWPDGKFDKRFFEIAHAFLKRPAGSPIPGATVVTDPTVTAYSGLNILNDMPLWDTLKIVVGLRSVVDRVLNDNQCGRSTACIAEFELTECDSLLCAIPCVTHQEAVAATVKAIGDWIKIREGGNARPGLAVTFDATIGMMVMAVPPRKGVSHAERLLDQLSQVGRQPNPAA